MAVICLGATSCSFSMTADKDVSAEASNVEIDTNGFVEGGDVIGGDNSAAASANEEKLFAQLLKACNASIAYNGSMTLNGFMSQTEKEDGEEFSISMDSTISMDAANKLYFYSTTAKRPGEGEYKGASKIFEKDGVFYEYEMTG